MCISVLYRTYVDAFFRIEKEYYITMNAGSGWVEKELLETFYLIVEEYKTGAIDENTFHDRIYKIAERYGRHVGKEESNRNQIPLFSS